MVTNFQVNAGRAAARLGGHLLGLQILAIVGYSPTSSEGVPHWRSGIVQQLQPDPEAAEIVLQFHWKDEAGEADIGIFDDEEIILCLTPEQQQHLILMFEPGRAACSLSKTA